MAFISVGVNHRTAPVDVRERVAFAPETVVEAMQRLCRECDASEVAILSTCNRTEIYAVVPDTALAQRSDMVDWLAEYHRFAADHLRDHSYQFSNDEAVQHLMEVACGLDSLVLGEPQIFGQLKSAYAVAREASTVGPHLNQLFQQTFSVAKRVRSETAIGKNPVSVAYAAVHLSQQIFADLKAVNALLIGAGETIDLVAQHLREKGINKLIVANRTLSRASELASRYHAEAVLLADIPAVLHEADIVISSTASQLPLLGKGAVESALKKRKHRPMFMVDIAVPRDIEAEVGDLKDVYLYTVDDLEGVIEENRRSRQDAAEHAREIIKQGVAQWQRHARSQLAVDAIKELRSAAEIVREEELQRALRQLESGQPAQEVIAKLARSLTNKLMHAPTTSLKEASESGNREAIEQARSLFGIAASNSDGISDEQ